ncbi:MAG: alpha-amylase family protein [Drouetiella hepatica Uher 2000/2452]|jgi:alpha-amylase|uniref:Alpha-amylase n=1 Tax=Drouetiella hepatica Uher 2000/2452 TaxID=904376 RepID=A0A951QF10_9CYAN|nr:alpha-amylase family protein [Drouetiella hepatica Uher 2000/2452]
MRFKKFWCSALFFSFLVLPLLLTSKSFDGFFAVSSSVSSPVPTSSSERSVFVHLFEWKWDDVAQECENFLAPNGYGAVQVSPATEHILAPQNPWWQRYQPVSYKINSRSGDRSQFAQMIARCHAVGVKVYADAVINHMAGIEGGVGSAGSVFTKYDYPGLYQPSDFHTCKANIKNYGIHKEVTQCELVGLADLDTSSPKVRRQIANYLADLVHLGVDGFRVDAAKHMDTQDIGAIVQLLQNATNVKPFIYQEVIDPGNEAVRKSEYYPNGKVIESEYGKFLGAKFLGIGGQTLSQLQTLGEAWGLMPNEKAIVFIDNHDKQRGHAGGGTYLTYKNGKLYDLANVFMLAFPYGTPQVMSSYVFTDSDQGPPANAQGQTDAVYVNGQTTCLKQWVCEHRHRAIAPMVKFRNQVAPDAPVTHWWSNGNNQIAFGRGSQGFVVINRENQLLTQTFQTNLPAGQYRNLIAEEALPEPMIVNAKGELMVTVNGMEAIAINLNSKL